MQKFGLGTKFLTLYNAGQTVGSNEGKESAPPTNFEKVGFDRFDFRCKVNEKMFLFGRDSIMFLFNKKKKFCSS